MSKSVSALDNADRAPGLAVAGDRGGETADLGEVSQAMIDMFPTPWRVLPNPGTNRSTIFAANDLQVMSGMNNTKALFIAHRTNCHADLLEQVRLLEKTIEYEIRRSKSADDDEGANLKGFTLHFVRESIARAEGRIAANAKAA